MAWEKRTDCQTGETDAIGVYIARGTLKRLLRPVFEWWDIQRYKAEHPACFQVQKLGFRIAGWRRDLYVESTLSPRTQ